MSEVVKLTIVSDSAEHVPEQPSKPLTVGEKLALARANLELSVEQVAGQLKWSARQISEIEAGNYSVFPDMLTVRGFVRTYAKILKIDSTALLDELASEFEKLPSKPIDRPKLDTPFPTGKMPILGRHHNNSQKLIGIAILLFLCLVMAFVYKAEIKNLVGSILPASTEKADVVSQVAAVNPDVVEKNTAVTSTESQPVAITPNAVEEKKSPTPESNLLVAQKPAAPVATATPHESSVTSNVSTTKPLSESTKPVSSLSEPVAIPESESLKFTFQQDSWIQVKNLSGTVVASKLYKAGTEEVFKVNEPLNIVVGNAPGVVAKLRGQELPLPVQSGSNVVNLSVK